MQRSMTAIHDAAITIARGLARPNKRASSDGMPKIPDPITALMTSAVNVQRPIERINGIAQAAKRV